MQYMEHEKRVWSVDFWPSYPTKLASGSDDCCVKLWSINEVEISLLLFNINFSSAFHIAYSSPMGYSSFSP